MRNIMLLFMFYYLFILNIVAANAIGETNNINLADHSTFFSGPLLSETVVNIGGITKLLNKSTSCAASNWANFTDNSCLCCLAKHILEGSDSQKATDYCINDKKYCTSSGLSTISRNLGLNTSNREKIADEIYRVVNKLPLIQTALQPVALSEKDVIAILSDAQKQGHLKLGDAMPLTSHPQCYQARKLSVTSGQTLQLFLISYNRSCPSFSGEFPPLLIIKEMKKALEEVRNLTNVEQEFRLFDSENLKLLALPISNIAYFDLKKNAHYLSVLPVAPGKSLKNWLDEYYAAPSQERYGNVVKIFYNFGFQLAKIHLDNMRPKGAIFGKTIIHNDLNLANAFASKDAQITFIDNETMAKSISTPLSPVKDLITFFFASTIFEQPQSFVRGWDINKPVEVEAWLNITLKPFIEGYASLYLNRLGQSKKSELTKALKSAYLDQSALSMLRILGTVVNPISFSSRYSKVKPYIEKIINGI